MNFHDFVSTPFSGAVNAICWDRKLVGDFSEIVQKVALEGNITVVNEAKLKSLQLSEQGQLARTILLADLKLLEEHGAAPTLNVIKCYEQDDSFPFLPTDVYSFHVDRSPVPADTFLCTYQGTSSDISPNEQATQKVLIPAIRKQLEVLYDGATEDF
jgi:hypothetical protein